MDGTELVVGGMQFRGEEVGFDEGLDRVEGDAREEGDVFEAGEEVCGCCLHLCADGDGGGEGGVEDGDVVVWLPIHHQHVVL